MIFNLGSSEESYIFSSEIKYKIVIIQDITIFINLIIHHIKYICILHGYEYSDTKLKQYLVWLIYEEFFLIYLYTNSSCDHLHNKYPETIIHNHLNKYLQIRLSILFKQYIIIPSIRINGISKISLQYNHDLYVYYN